MKTAVLLLSLAAAAAAASAAAVQPGNWADFDSEWASSPEFETSKALCRAVRGRAPPAADRPMPAEAAALADCSSEALYYGIGIPADPEKARHCAFLEADDADAPSSAFSGRAMLMTIYANGRGARRDLDVALSLACEIDGAPAESHGRVTRLAQLRASRWTGTDFDYCDDITSGISSGHCAARDAAIEGARRDAELARLAAGMAEAARPAYVAMRAAAEAYAVAHADGEVDMSGTLRTLFHVAAAERIRSETGDLVKMLEEGRAPSGSQAGFRVADAALNAAYRAALRADYGDAPGSVRPEGIRQAQRAWLRYRDAFLAFAAQRYRDADQDAIAAFLTQQRTERLVAGPD
jgi:uncharacterized protein YecT (DUF1311 family)